MKGISVIICCYNSVSRLPQTIKHIALQKVPVEINWEIILVNNNSTDETAEVAKNQWEKYQLNIPFSIVEQPQPGLPMARVKGIETAKFETLLFCDDDNWLFNDYVANGYQIGEDMPELGIWGAAESIGVFEVPEPKWFIPYRPMVAIFNNNIDMVGFSESIGVVSGAGMLIRNSIAQTYVSLLEKDPFRKLLGRAGNIPMSGEDTDIHIISSSLGYKVGYFKRLTYQHYMPASRITKAYLIRLKQGMSCSSVILAHIHNRPQGKWNFLGLMKHLLITLFKDVFLFKMVIADLKGHYWGLKLIKEHTK